MNPHFFNTEVCFSVSISFIFNSHLLALILPLFWVYKYEQQKAWCNKVCQQRHNIIFNFYIPDSKMLPVKNLLPSIPDYGSSPSSKKPTLAVWCRSTSSINSCLGRWFCQVSDKYTAYVMLPISPVHGWKTVAQFQHYWSVLPLLICYNTCTACRKFQASPSWKNYQSRWLVCMYSHQWWPSLPCNLNSSNLLASTVNFGCILLP